MMRLPVETTSDEVHAHARHTGRPWLDLVLALSAIFISLISLVVAVEHGRTERALVDADTWPFLQIEGNLGKDEVHFDITNSGVGPAKLRTMEIFLHGKPVADMRTLLEQCCGLPRDPSASQALFPSGLSFSDVNNTVFRAGETLLLLNIVPSKDGLPIAHAAQEALRNGSITFKGCYCSVFDACWMANMMDLNTRRVSTCPAVAVPFDRSGSIG